MEVNYTITKTKDGFIAECTNIDVVTQGETMEELLDNLFEAIELHLESMEELKIGG